MVNDELLKQKLKTMWQEKWMLHWVWPVLNACLSRTVVREITLCFVSLGESFQEVRLFQLHRKSLKFDLCHNSISHIFAVTSWVSAELFWAYSIVNDTTVMSETEHFYELRRLVFLAWNKTRCSLQILVSDKSRSLK